MNNKTKKPAINKDSASDFLKWNLWGHEITRQVIAVLWKQSNLHNKNKFPVPAQKFKKIGLVKDEYQAVLENLHEMKLIQLIRHKNKPTTIYLHDEPSLAGFSDALIERTAKSNAIHDTQEKDQSTITQPKSTRPSFVRNRHNKSGILYLDHFELIFRGLPCEILDYFYNDKERTLKSFHDLPERFQSLTTIEKLRKSISGINTRISKNTEGGYAEIIAVKKGSGGYNSANQYRWKL